MKKNVSESREIPVTNLPAGQEKPEQVTQNVIESVLQLGINLISVPLVLLPAESRTHMEAAGREFARGFVVLARELVKIVEQITTSSGKDAVKSTNKS